MDMTARAGKILQAQWTELDHLRRMVLKNTGVEAIHDLRVATRRLRTTLRLLAPFVSRKRMHFISMRIRRVTRKLGRLRNLDEAIAFFSAATGLEELTEQLAALRAHEMNTVIRTLRRFSYAAIDRKIRKTASELGGASSTSGRFPAFPVYLSGVSINGFQTIHHLLVPATAPESSELRHTLRIGIKKWRYLLETIALVENRDYTTLLELLKEYQTLLGRMNDMVEFSVLCASLEVGADCRSRIDACLSSSGEALFKRFCKLVESKPLHYTFIL